MMRYVIPVEPFDFVIFGATGDLARRKIFPSLFRRWKAGQIQADSRIFAIGRRRMQPDAFRTMIGDALRDFLQAEEWEEEALNEFLQLIDFVRIDVAGEDGWPDLQAKIEDNAKSVRAFYLSVGPELFGPIAKSLSIHGIALPDSRIVIEKPFGHDVVSARELNAQLSMYFDEKQIYRIDHYLGKETVQNLMALRFSNALFEPLWNAHHIDHVQITVAESIGVKGRGGYYDQAGALRDMVQNHIMQLLCLIAMEPPSRFDPDSVRDEKLKVIRSLDPIDDSQIVRGQYRGDDHTPSYQEDAGNETSKTESFVALKVGISNWRWAGVPFYLRTGKRLRAQVSEIEVHFKEPPHNIFQNAGVLKSNTLIIRLQPDEGITLNMTIKQPGQGGLRLTQVPLDMTFAEVIDGHARRMADAYERLIMDVMRGDQTLFMRGDEVEAAWMWIDPIIEAWGKNQSAPYIYDSGGSGPEASLALMHRDNRQWREIGL